VDQIATATQAGKTYFGGQTPVTDSVGGQSACQLLSITRSQGLPPTAAQLAALAGLFGSAHFRQTFHLQH